MCIIGFSVSIAETAAAVYAVAELYVCSVNVTAETAMRVRQRGKRNEGDREREREKGTVCMSDDSYEITECVCALC